MKRFWDKVDKSGDCWEWTSAKVCGYGSFWLNGGPVMAHRLSWELTNGPIPKGEGYHGTCVCHTCDNRGCVNPDHLFISDHAGNMSDKAEKGRSIKGSQHSQSKLHENDIPRIRDMLRCGARHIDIAEWFGVARPIITNINCGRSWTHVG